MTPEERDAAIAKWTPLDLPTVSETDLEIWTDALGLVWARRSGVDKHGFGIGQLVNRGETFCASHMARLRVASYASPMGRADRWWSVEAFDGQREVALWYGPPEACHRQLERLLRSLRGLDPDPDVPG